VRFSKLAAEAPSARIALGQEAGGRLSGQPMSLGGGISAA
jgi:hypothetical protein